MRDLTIISNKFLTVSINRFGAELNSIKNNQNKEYLWEGNSEFWGKKAPILFPIVGGLKGNTYKYKNHEYKLNRHGFARDMFFELITQEQELVVFSLKSTSETLINFPFDFELQISYQLKNNNLEVKYTVFNNGKENMPFSIGGHPAFALKEDFEDYQLEFENDETLTYYSVENNLISNEISQIKLNNKQLSLNYNLFKNDALVFKELKSKKIAILNNNNKLISIEFLDFPNLGIWTPLNAPFICIEPWIGYADTNKSSGNILEKEGIKILEPNTVFNAKYNITFY